MTQSQEQSKDIQNLIHKIKTLENQLEILQHQNKKTLIGVKTQLEFQKNRALEFQEKYKTTIKYKNQQENFKQILNELDQKLSMKQNQIIQLMKSQQEKKKRITQLLAEIDLLKNQSQVQTLRQQLQKMQQAAVSAIMEKDNTITQLQQKLSQYQSNNNSVNLKQIIVELEDRYRQVEDKLQSDRIQFQHIIQSKQEQFQQLNQKFQSYKQRSQQRIARLQQDVQDYQAHIEKINQQKYNQESLQQKYYLTQDKLRKIQKKLHDTQLTYKDQKILYQDAIQKLQHQLNKYKQEIQDAKNLNNKIKQLQKDLKNKKKQIQDNRAYIQKTKIQYTKKYTTLESQKKKIHDTLQTKIQEFQKYKIDIEEKSQHKNGNNGVTTEITPFRQSGTSQTPDVSISPRKSISKKEEEAMSVVQNLKLQIKDRDDNVIALNNKLEKQTKQIQQLRQRLVSTSGSASRSEVQAKLMVQIEDLNSHIKKLEHNLLLSKLNYAEDQMYMKSREDKSKKIIDEMEKQFKKDKAELLERIDRMKRNNAKDKKMDYYQTSLK